MGATNNIKETNITLQLADKTCSQCSQKFTQQEIEERNWDIYFDTTNDVKLIDLAEIKAEDTSRLYFPIKREGFMFTIWIRSIEHEYCPATEPCQSCNQRFLVETMINPKGNFDYYCSPCYQQISKDHD